MIIVNKRIPKTNGELLITSRGEYFVKEGVLGSPTAPDLFLDQVGTEDVVTSFSVRKLTKEYNGPCVRVRRVSDDEETDIGFENNRIDVDELENFSGGADARVVIWYDQTEGGQDAVQTSASEQPLIVENGSVLMDNGRPTVNFNGDPEKLVLGSIGLGGDTNRTISSVTRDFLARGSGGAFLGINRDSGGGTTYDVCIESDSVVTRVSGGNHRFENNVTNDIDQMRVISRLDGTDVSDVRMFVNNDEIPTSSINSRTLSTVDDWLIGHSPRHPVDYFIGNIQELIVWDIDTSVPISITGPNDQMEYFNL